MPRARLKPLSDQVIVITGASSGHGLTTARRAAKAGAKVVLVARDEAALNRVAEDIRAAGGVAEVVAADVGEAEDVERVVRLATDVFGGFDTWVNNAGSGVYATLLDLPIEDHRKVFETNYWGLVHGSLAAVRHFRNRPHGGALINVGSINGDMPSPLLGAYNASKHAVKGFTDSLRIELIREGAPVAVTLIKPSAIGTPFPRHGRNLTGQRARLPQPIYSPELVADAILYAAQRPVRALTVGGMGRLQVAAANLTPGLFDLAASRMGPTLIDYDTPAPFEDGSLYEPQGDDGDEQGRQKGRRVSLYTAAKLNPGVTAVAAVLVGAGLAAWVLRRPARALAAAAIAGAAASSVAQSVAKAPRRLAERGSSTAWRVRDRVSDGLRSLSLH